MSDQPSVTTCQVNLTDLSWDELREKIDDAARDQLIDQVEKPRYNIGNSGPPGRAD